jgi:hypothetical protein
MSFAHELLLHAFIEQDVRDRALPRHGTAGSAIPSPRRGVAASSAAAGPAPGQQRNAGEGVPRR